ncbi:hypothetical protein OS188_09030 [Xanthomarina sp. F1114]|uniref:hypothetical protein n=1 Tax=Xanthomarina sp. F1114 TaxID=2996019 RepID=UPI00225E2CDE|nr:hypothetical protein [Xanthomarina sp. F1114]MCX7548094.1 hypothetical protein [Xanthomarina sp. F1114]
MKRSLLFTLLLIITTNLLAQDPYLQKSDNSLKDEVSTITNAYNKEIALDGKQLGLFEIKVEEFLIRRKKIESLLEGKEKLKTLYKLQEEETLEMQDILTHNQLQVYKEVKPRIQPIERLEPSTDLPTSKE